MSKQDAQDELHAREALLGLIRELAESGVVLGAEAVERLRTALRAELAGGESVVTWPEASGEDPDFGAGRGSGGVGVSPASEGGRDGGGQNAPNETET